jgi:hypothetical protein
VTIKPCTSALLEPIAAIAAYTRMCRKRRIKRGH